jgi:hypothetical protein
MEILFAMDNLLLDTALAYANLGWAIFPCREKPGRPYLDKHGKMKIPKEKSPYVSSGFKEATTDPNIINDWWHKWSNACIGISCQHSNLFLIDIDVKDGRNGIDNYMMLGISDTGALHSRTPSKGLHILFSGKGKTSTNTLLGIDTRGDGGYFIAPPSIIVEGINAGKYIALDIWNHIPIEIPTEAMEKLHVDNHRIHKSKKDIYTPDKINNPETIARVKDSLEKLSPDFYNEYYRWIEIGMCLYDLGNEGLELWDNWSKKSDKYEEGECQNRWETFSPNEISLASLFYYAKNS